MYAAIICLFVPIWIRGIHAYTTVLVGAPCVLGYCVKCIPIDLVPFVRADMPRWLSGQQIKLLIYVVITLTLFSQPIAEGLHVLTCNPRFTLPGPLGSKEILMYLDIWIDQ